MLPDSRLLKFLGSFWVGARETARRMIGVPDGTRHWFDMGPNPYFVAIRLFTNAAGWVANFTGSEIASRYSRLDN